jgi:hypothetical protein
MRTIDIDLPFGYTPRKYQLQILRALDKGCKRLVVVMHRRAGKDLTVWNWCIKEYAVGVPSIVWYVFPTYSQAKRVIWDGMTKEGKRFLDYIPKELIKQKYENELKIKFVNGSILQLIGSDNLDALMGSGPRCVVFSEASMHDPRAWDLIRPMLTETNGTAIFISTPRGKNWFYDLFCLAEKTQGMQAIRLSVAETGAISEEDIEQERRQGMSEEMVQQEFYCSWEASVLGAYYARLMSKVRKESRIQIVPYDEDLLVYTAWDLGYTDTMSIIFFQLRGEQIRVIDYYENHGYQLSHYLNILATRHYIYGEHWAPHDGAAHDRAGNTFVQKAREYGYDFNVLPNKYTILEGIEKVRAMLPRCYFDEVKCDRLIKALENYHSKYDPVRQSYSMEPDHNWASHGADAFRYLALATEVIRQGRGMTPESIQEIKWRALAERDREMTPHYKQPRYGR